MRQLESYRYMESILGNYNGINKQIKLYIIIMCSFMYTEHKSYGSNTPQHKSLCIFFIFFCIVIDNVYITSSKCMICCVVSISDKKVYYKLAGPGVWMKTWSQTNTETE